MSKSRTPFSCPSDLYPPRLLLNGDKVSPNLALNHLYLCKHSMHAATYAQLVQTQFQALTPPHHIFSFPSIVAIIISCPMFIFLRHKLKATAVYQSSEFLDSKNLGSIRKGESVIEGQWWKVTPIAPAVTPGAPHRLLLFPEARNVKNPLAGSRRHFLVHRVFFLARKKEIGQLRLESG